MKTLSVLIILLVGYEVSAYSSKPLSVLRQLMERPSKVMLLIAPEKRGDAKANPISARTGRGGQWDLDSDTPTLVFEDLFPEVESENGRQSRN